MCNEDQTVSFPPLCFDDSGNSALLMESSVETNVDGERLSGVAKVKLDLLPSPSVYVYCKFGMNDITRAASNILSNPDAITYLDINGLRLNGFGLRSNLLLTEQTLDVKWCPSDVPVRALGDKSTKMQATCSHLFNLDFPGRPGSIQRDGQGNHTIEHIDLESDTWRIRIRSLKSTRENRRILQQEGGFRLTHVAEIRKNDGSDHSSEEAEDVLDALRIFLCFSKGTQCDPICPYGVDAEQQVVWSQWSSPREWERSPLSWFERTDSEPLLNLFPGFMERWTMESWREALNDCIWLYANANSSSRGIDVGLVSAQTAIERLSYEYCVFERKLIGRQGFKSISAADKFRLLLSSLSIPLEIPPSATSLAQVARNRNWADGPQALTEIRNDLVHGGLKRMQLPNNCYVDAWKLSLWFVEMTVLAICEFKGTHWNRNTRTAEPVPW